MLGSGGVSPCKAAAANACLVDDTLAVTKVKSGYKFSYTPAAAVSGIINAYTSNADPAAPGSSGQSTFFTDESGVIRKDPTGAAPATVASPALQ
jgi:hypothetical protein